MKRKIRLITAFAFAFLAFLLIDSNTAYANGEFNINNNNVLIGYNGTGGDVKIPDGVVSIGRTAFKGCEKIASVTFPDSVKVIEDSAFDSCSGITSVTFPKKLEKIGDNAFWGCTALKKFTIPDSVTEIGFGAFCNCESLDSISIPKTVKYLGNYSVGYICVNGKYSPVPDYAVFGTASSAAQEYADKNSFKFLTAGDLTAKINKASNNKKGKATVSWIRNENTTGYEIQYATNKKFSKAKTVTAKTSQSSKTISSMKKGSTYYFRVRGYRTIAGKKYYSAWSATKSIKIKK